MAVVAIFEIIASPYLGNRPNSMKFDEHLAEGNLMKPTVIRMSTRQNWYKELFLLNSALVLEVYLLQRSLFYRLFRM